MNLDIFKPNNEDGAFLAYIKREALSIINTIEYLSPHFKRFGKPVPFFSLHSSPAVPPVKSVKTA